MDRTEIARQQARLAEFRAQQRASKETDRTTSAAKEVDPQRQPFKDQAPLKPEFERAHDHAAEEKKGAQVIPLRQQDAARPAPGMSGPTAPSATGPEADREAHFSRLSEDQRAWERRNEAAKIRQEQAERERMENDKDHDRD